MANITVPSHLLTTCEPGEEWTPTPADRQDTIHASLQAAGSFQGSDVASENEARERDVIKKDDGATNQQRPSHTLHDGRRRGTTGRLATRRYHSDEATTNHQDTRLQRMTLPSILDTSSDESLRERKSPFPNEISSRQHSAQGNLPIHRQRPLGNTESRDVSGLFDRMAAYDFAQPRHTVGNARMSLQIDPFEDPPTQDPFADPPTATSPTHQEDIDDVPALRGARTNSTVLQRSMGVMQTIAQEISPAVTNAMTNIAGKMRQGSVAVMYEKAKVESQRLQRKPWVQKTFQYSCYVLILLFVYFVLIGLPLWKGAVLWLYWVVENKFTVAGTWSVTIGLAVIYAYLPLLLLFEKEPPMPDEEQVAGGSPAAGTHNTALIIPCYKAGSIIGPTLLAAKRIFPASHIFVIANGNSATPLDNTEEVCSAHGVNHVWSPIGSKIVAQFVGCHVVAKLFENVLMIDDDCALPPNFPIVSDRMQGKVKCIGYTIKSTGPDSSVGTWCQQAQDLEYKLSGMQRAVAGVMGSATFPHGAISIWNTRFLIDTFNTHPGFNVSEDWFFGHQARELGCRIKMCTAVFVKTETPSAIFLPEKGGARGGFGEMTVFKQRFYRWNFFFVNGLWYNMKYILLSWKLGWWEFGAKLFVLQEVYETLLYLLAPFVLPISLVVQPAFCGYLLAGTFGIYWLNALIFNEIHLRLRNERVASIVVYGYYHFYKIALTVVNVASCYYALFKYARYFANRHPKVVQNEKALEVVLKLNENTEKQNNNTETRPRRFTVTAIGVPVESQDNSEKSV